MAIVIIGLTECSLCKKKLQTNDKMVAFIHFISDSSDPLWKYSDSVMHQSCFDAWPDRELFRQKFNSCESDWIMDSRGSYSKKCTCDPKDLFNFGCKCGA